MKNGLAKVLHPLAGRPLLAHVLATVEALRPEPLVAVLAPGAEEVARALRGQRPDARIVVQDPPLGTGHAVQVALDALPAEGTLLVVYADTPLLRQATLRALAARRAETGAAVCVLAIRPDDPRGYGRLRLDERGGLLEIVEERHADARLLAGAPCNSGVMALDLARLRGLVAALEVRPEKGEIYLTDIVAEARRRGLRCEMLEAAPEEGLGVNSQRDLARLEALFQERRRIEALDAGVIMPAPDTVHFAHDTRIAPGARIEPYVVFGPGVEVEAGAVVHSFSHLEGARVGAHASVGPFARLRPGSVIGPHARIGNFVEVKNSSLGEGAKANHLSYLGDSTVGAGANIGAGTITCNYDGFAKHRTAIGAGAFIGSNTALVAPVEIGEGAVVGAGSTITRDVPAQAVAIARARERIGEERAPALRERLRRRRQRREA